MAEEDRRAERYRFAGLLVPLLAISCGVIVVLVALGLLDLLYSTVTHQRLFAGGPVTPPASIAAPDANPTPATATQ